MSDISFSRHVLTQHNLFMRVIFDATAVIFCNTGLTVGSQVLHQCIYKVIWYSCIKFRLLQEYCWVYTGILLQESDFYQRAAATLASACIYVYVCIYVDRFSLKFDRYLQNQVISCERIYFLLRFINNKLDGILKFLSSLSNVELVATIFLPRAA